MSETCQTCRRERASQESDVPNFYRREKCFVTTDWEPLGLEARLDCVERGYRLLKEEVPLSDAVKISILEESAATLRKGIDRLAQAQQVVTSALGSASDVLKDYLPARGSDWKLDLIQEALGTLAFCAEGVYGGDDSFANASKRAAARSHALITQTLRAKGVAEKKS